MCRANLLKEGKKARDIMSNPADGLSNRVIPVTPKQIDDDRSDNGKIDQGIAITHRRVVFFEHDIFDPMQPILNVPVVPIRSAKPAASRAKELI